MIVRDIHRDSLAISSALSEYYVPYLITPREVIRVLNAAKVKFMLVGAHGIGGWMRKARATEDVDIDLEKLTELGQLVYNGGGAEVVEKVRQVRAGERMKL